MAQDNITLQELEQIMKAKEFLTTNEVAKYLGVSPRTVRDMVNGRSLPYYKPTGGRIYIKRVDLLEWLEASRVSTEEEQNTMALQFCLKGGAK